MSSTKQTKAALHIVEHLAESYGLTADAEHIADLPARIFTAYGGAKVVEKVLRDASIAAVKCGAAGRWLAVLPLEKLLGFIADARQFQRICDND